MNKIFAAFFLPFLFVFPVFAQSYRGEQPVRLLERAANIPAHRGPRDRPAALFRSVGGSTGKIIAVDRATGWLRPRKQRVGGPENGGWIVRRSIAAVAAAGPSVPPSASQELAWCPAKGSPNPHLSGRLRLATWNIENLAARDGQSIFLFPTPTVKRNAVDYERIKCYVRMIDPDILAVQEVDGEAALKRVVDTDVYNVVVSGRPARLLSGKQNTGFAYKKGLDVQLRPDFRDIDVSGGALHWGTRIDLVHNGQTFRLMNVHLNSGCFDNQRSGSACTELFQQIAVLKKWIDAVAASPDKMILFGDFNRRLNQPGDKVWQELDDANPPNADLTAVTENMPVSCRDNRRTEFIDHIVFDKRSIVYVDRSSFRQVTYRQADMPDWNKISDHCPVVVEMWVR